MSKRVMAVIKDGADEWDPITMTDDGGVIWHNYANPRRIVVTYDNETPQQAAARYQSPAEERAMPDLNE